MGLLTWKVSGASVAGFSHKSDGSPCQDAHAAETLPGEWFVGVVSDGAGSAAHSAEGARYLCDMLLSHLCVRLREPRSNENPDHVDESTVRAWVEDGIEYVRAQLNDLSAMRGTTMADFHATLIGAVVGPVGGVFFHIGDGAGCATFSENLSSVVLSPPENGEYANETYFFTENKWRDHLRTVAFGSQHDLIALMSDGVTPFALTRGSAGLSLPFFEPISRFIADNDREVTERALVRLLERDAIRHITADDKTLLLARRVELDG